jgi:hypothetical protein
VYRIINCLTFAAEIFASCAAAPVSRLVLSSDEKILGYKLATDAPFTATSPSKTTDFFESRQNHNFAGMRNRSAALRGAAYS